LIMGMVVSWASTNSLRRLLLRPELSLTTREVRQQLDSRYLKWAVIAGGLFTFLASYFLYQHFSQPVKPPATAMVQQEFSRYQKNDRPLDNSWRTYALKSEDVWKESGFDFRSQDYFWLISFDSAFIKIQSLVGDSTKIIKMASRVQQVSLGKNSAVYLSVPLKNPPLYNGQATNLFLKRWSFDAMVAQRRFLVFPALFLIGLGSFVLSFAFFGYKEAGLVSDSPQGKPTERGAMTGMERGKTAVMGDGSYDRANQNIVQMVEQITDELAIAYQTGRTGNVVKAWWKRIQDHNLVREVEGKIKNIDELTKFRDSVRELASSDLKDKEKFSGLKANIAENEAREAKAAKEKRGYSEVSATATEDCKVMLERYRLQLMKAGYDTIKDPLQLSELGPHHDWFVEQSNIYGFIEKLVLEESITSPQKLESLIQDIIQDDQRSTTEDKATQAYEESLRKHEAPKQVIAKKIKELQAEKFKLEKALKQFKQIEDPPDQVEISIKQCETELERVNNDIIAYKQKLKSMSG